MSTNCSIFSCFRDGSKQINSSTNKPTTIQSTYNDEIIVPTAPGYLKSKNGLTFYGPIDGYQNRQSLTLTSRNNNQEQHYEKENTNQIDYSQQRMQCRRDEHLSKKNNNRTNCRLVDTGREEGVEIKFNHLTTRRSSCASSNRKRSRCEYTHVNEPFKTEAAIRKAKVVRFKQPKNDDESFFSCTDEFNM